MRCSVLVVLVSVLFVALTNAARAGEAVEISALGLAIETVTPELAEKERLSASSGVVVRTIKRDGPGALGGIKRGDIVIELAGLPVGDVDDVVAITRRTGSEPVEIAFVRGEKENRVELVPLPQEQLARKPDEPKRRSAFRKPSPTPEATDDQPFSVVKVFYGTDRNNTGSPNPKLVYGIDRGKLVYGSCEVSLPVSHKVGELESPSWLRLEIKEDPAKHIILGSVKEQKAGDFYADIVSRFRAAGKKSAFVFVHGYNVSFEDAARRTAQLAHDLRFEGAPVFFSWPSQARYLGYPVDENNVDFARSDLRDFIKEFVRSTGAEQLFLIAHSMGNRALTGAVSDLYKSDPEVSAKIKEVILAAPDIDADVFKRDIAPAMSGNGQSVTLYASSGDWALKASKKWHGYPRAGESGDGIVVLPTLVTIDASGVGTDMFGHGYFADSSSIVSDIGAIIDGRSKPELRDLKRVDDAAGAHWRISPGVQ